MTAVVPRHGEEILIHRPGAPDIRMLFEREDPAFYGLGRSEGWLWLNGEILEGLHNAGIWKWQTLHARTVEPGVYEMVGVRA